MLDTLCETCGQSSDCPFDVNFPKIEMYEIHVTVETNDPQHFKQVCEENGIKPILIEFQGRSTENVVTHVMTSQKAKGAEHAEAETARVVQVLKDAGFKILRVKVEASLDVAEKMEPHDVLYYESHLAFRVPESAIQRLRLTCEAVGIHLSKNAFKAHSEGTVTMMGTVRIYHTYPVDFQNRCIMIKEQMEGLGFPSEKLICECVITDDNLSLDDEWLGVNKNGHR